MKNIKLLLFISLVAGSIFADETEKQNVLKMQGYGEFEVTDASGDQNIFYNFACNCDNRDYEYVVTARLKPVALMQDITEMFAVISKASHPAEIRRLAAAEIARFETLQKSLENDASKKALSLLSEKDEQGRTAEDILRQKLEGFDQKSSEEQINLGACIMLEQALRDLRKGLDKKEAESNNDNY